jgi:phospholipid/cholesterol/gamma-HCH transport system substrate-binding protein
MSKKTATHIKLGIFVAIGFLLFAAAIYVLGTNQQLFNRTFHISGSFSNVNGLQAGNNVSFSGITVGIVQRIEIESDTTVRVDLSINEDVRRFIKEDAVGLIGTESLMGNKVFIITSGTSSLPEIKDGATIKTTPPMNMDQLMVTFKTTNDNIAQITGDLADIVRSIRDGKGTIGQLLMDSTYLTVPVENATRITSDLREIVESIRSGEGVVGRLLADTTAALSMDTTLINIKLATENMKRVSEKAKRSFLLWGF